MAAERQLLSPHFLDVFGRPAIASRIGKVRAPFDFAQDRIVGEHHVDSVWHGRGEVPQEVASDALGGLLVQLHKGELGLPVDCHQQAGLALLGAHLGEIDVKVADWIGPLGTHETGLTFFLAGLSPSTSGNRLIP